MFDVLMYLFETYIHSDADVMVEQDELTDELSRAGFNQEEIEKALNWLERLANLHDSEREVYVTASAQGSMRIYAPQELARLSTECRGFLLFLEQAQVLNAETREICIERLLELDKPDIELDDLKWVVMMVLFNVPGSENAYQQMEELVFDESDGVIHWQSGAALVEFRPSGFQGAAHVKNRSSPLFCPRTCIRARAVPAVWCRAGDPSGQAWPLPGLFGLPLL